MLQPSPAESFPKRSPEPAEPRRGLPSVDRVLRELGPQPLPRPVVVREIRRVLSGFREGDEAAPAAAVLGAVRSALQRQARGRVRPVINATGIVLHTNLGRAPLSARATDAVASVARHYSNLEFDLDSGQRGSRGAALEQDLAQLCGAEAATVVNNCAAALVLVLRHFTRVRREVVVSRGELVQIGGGFRVPEILESAGAVLRECGTTNRTSAADYERVIGADTGLLLKVHRSNFHLSGFVGEAAAPELAALAAARGVPFVEDLGSGAVWATGRVDGLEHEPGPAEVLREGADLVTFSGDKLFGGPQAGVIAGRASHVSALKRDPFFRALRCDKLVLAALHATVEDHLDDSAAEAVPVRRLLAQPLPELRARAERLVRRLADAGAEGSLCDTVAEVGGGSLPASRLPSVGVELKPAGMRLEDLLARLRLGEPPVVAYLHQGACRLDLRTVFAEQDAALAAAVIRSLSP